MNLCVPTMCQVFQCVMHACYCTESLQQLPFKVSIVIPALYGNRDPKRLCIFPKVTQVPVTEPRFKPELSSSDNCSVFPLHYAGYLRNDWHCHPCFSRVRNESKSSCINAHHIHLSGASVSNTVLTSTK